MECIVWSEMKTSHLYFNKLKDLKMNDVESFLTSFYKKFCCLIVNSDTFIWFCSYAASVGAKHFHTSAKLNKGIEEMFLDLSKGESQMLMSYLIHCNIQ